MYMKPFFCLTLMLSTEGAKKKDRKCRRLVEVVCAQEHVLKKVRNL